MADADATNEAARLLRLFLAARKTGGSYDLDIIAANVETVLNALDDAQKRVTALEAEQPAEGWESMVPQSCDAGVHADWAVAAEDDRHYTCPWCQLAEQRDRADTAVAEADRLRDAWQQAWAERNEARTRVRELEAETTERQWGLRWTDGDISICADEENARYRVEHYPQYQRTVVYRDLRRSEWRAADPAPDARGRPDGDAS